jgi:hypothetical protein
MNRLGVFLAQTLLIGHLVDKMFVWRGWLDRQECISMLITVKNTVPQSEVI